MEVSPLVQQARPDTFKPKIVQLYTDLLRQDDEDLADSDGFWREFFLLRPDKSGLQQLLESLHADDLLQLQHETRQLFATAVHQVKVGKGPMDVNALDTLTVFLGVILAKRYTNPSADIITVVAGLDEVDTVFSDFANAIENSVRIGRSSELSRDEYRNRDDDCGAGEIREKAIDVALSLTSGAYQTSLVSYFTHRDLFPALMKYIQDCEVDEKSKVEDSNTVFKPFLLLGLLANYNKFESRNPYRARFEDFVNEATIQKIVRGLGKACSRSRDHYVAIHDDVAEGWTLSNTLTYIGLGILAPTKAAPVPVSRMENGTEDFASLPDPNVAVLLGAYDFTTSNKLFCLNLLSCSAESKNGEVPFSGFLSLTSYILHHAYRSQRATLYGLLNLLILRVVIEDLVLCKSLCDPEQLLSVRLCRQRQPFLPATPKPRPAIESIFDILIDTVNHNLRRNLDIHLYISTIGLIHRLLSYLTFTRTRLPYHWSLLWQTLLSFLRFLVTYAPSLSVQDPDLPLLLNPFLSTLALAVISGDSFLPDPTAYDDLFYKLVETGEYLNRFKKAFASQIAPPNDSMGFRPSRGSSDSHPTAPIDILIHVSAHYHDLVVAEKDTGRMGNNPSPREVSKVIRQGYETLSLPTMEGLDKWDRLREGDERSMLKRAARTAVEDTRRTPRGV